VLEKYLEAFNVDTQYEIIRAKLVTLVVAQNVAKELEKDKKTSGKSKIPSFGRGPIKSKGE